MSKKPKLTPWFPGYVKPSRVGGYAFSYECGYEFDAWWDGKNWLVNDKSALRFCGDVIPDPSAHSWRGLAVKP